VIYYFADNHFGKHPGAEIYNRLTNKEQIKFFEDDFSGMENSDFAEKCSLLILNMIGTTSGLEHPSKAAEVNIRNYLEAGGDMLLLHGSSAAFWQWDWWRTCAGLRWVRGEDPDNVESSTHPRRPFTIKVSKTRHHLCKKLVELAIPHEEEIYINLEQTNPVTVLMETRTDEGTYPQCYESETPWGGRVLCFLPGHEKETAELPAYMQNIQTLLDDLLADGK